MIRNKTIIIIITFVDDFLVDDINEIISIRDGCGDNVQNQ